MCSARRSKRQGNAGFTLVEMAVVVVIAGLILTALLPALLDIQRSGRLSATQTNMQSLLRATAAYALANGCLPCPTPGNKIGSVERGKVGTPGNSACGVCASADGIAPFAALGIDQSTARDGWGRWITMHIDTALAQPCSAAELAAATPGCAANDVKLCHMPLANATRTQVNYWLADQNTQMPVAVLFVSHGANGYGAYLPAPTVSGNPCRNTRQSFPADAACATPSNLELCNDKCRVPDNQFYQVERGEKFDDILTYADRNALVSMFGTAACTSKW